MLTSSQAHFEIRNWIAKTARNDKLSKQHGKHPASLGADRLSVARIKLPIRKGWRCDIPTIGCLVCESGPACDPQVVEDGDSIQ